MKKIKKDTNHRNIVPAGWFVKNLGRRGILIAAGAILLAAALIVCLSSGKKSNPVPPEPPAVPASETPSALPETPAPLPRAERASVRTVRCSRGRKRTFVRAVLRRAHVIYRLQ